MDKTFLSENDLDEMGILSRMTRWRMRKTGDFPQPVRISKGRVGYPKSTIDAWVAERSEVISDAA